MGVFEFVFEYEFGGCMLELIIVGLLAVVPTLLLLPLPSVDVDRVYE